MPNFESLWWASVHAKENKDKLQVGILWKLWPMPSCVGLEGGGFDLLGWHLVRG